MTAVEWFNQQLVDKQIGKGDSRSWDTLFKQAKEMEKQQIIDAYGTAEDNCEWLIEEHKWQRFHSEQYYNETFNKIP
jgi:hypothetical protein